MLTRFFAVLATLALAAGLAVTTAAPASAHTPTVSSTCSTLKVDLRWYGAGKSNYVTVTIDGEVVEDHTKFGDSFFEQYTVDTTSSHSWKVEIDAQDAGYDRLEANALTGTWIPCAGTDLTCDAATLYKGSPLSNGDHINMDVTRNGGETFQVNAYVDIRQAQDPASESGLVVRLKLTTGEVTLPLTNAQKTSGILELEYSESWTGTWTVQWVQYNSSYFNQNRDQTKFLFCDRSTPVTVSTEPSATPPTCAADGSLVVPSIPHITWTGGANGAGPGEYHLVAEPAEGYSIDGESEFDVVVLAAGSGLSCAEPTRPTLEPAVCEPGSGTATSAYIVIPSTPHVAYRIGSTTYAAGDEVALAPGTHVVHVDVEEGWLNAGPDSYEIVVDEVPGCDQPVDYVAPTVNPELCIAGTDAKVPGSLTFPSDVEHLAYTLDGDPVALGETVQVTAGSHEIGVTVDEGYFLAGTDGLTEKTYSVTVPAATDCDEPTPYVAPTVVAESCDAQLGGTADGSVTFVLQPHLGYVFDGETVDAENLVFERPAGDYTLVVTADDGYFIEGADVVTKEYTITVDAAEDCAELVTLPLDPYASPETCVPGSLEGGVDDGALTIVGADHVTFSVSNDADGVRHPVSTPVAGEHYAFPYPAGDYHVWAELDEGYITHSATSWALTVDPPSLDCDLPTFALLPTGVSWAGEKCTDDGVQPATITVEPFTGVSYFIDGEPVTSTTTVVAAGFHEITAEADEPTNTVETAYWSVTLAAATALCGELTTLALTGGGVGGIGIVALVLLQAGLVLVAVAILTRRRPARHRAG